MENGKDLMQEGLAIFTRIFMKYDALEKEPLDMGNGEKLSAVNIHTIEAIGKEYGKTVTALSEYFMITKGAVSQVITKLHKDGYVSKVKKKGNDKEVILELTKKGWKAFELHEKLNEAAMGDWTQIRNKYSADEAASFLSILGDIDLLFSQLIIKEKKNNQKF
jgi:DNA-binding MarR family transcriptional regulator